MTKHKNITIITSYTVLMVLSSMYINRYTITLIPIILSIIALYLYKDDLRTYDYSRVTSRYTYEMSGFAFIYSAASQGLCNFIAKLLTHETHQNLSMQLFNVPVIPVYVVCFSPCIEELIFRRIIFGYLDKKFNFWIASIISSTLFAAAHMSLPLFAGYFLVGMTLCWAYKKSGYLPVVIGHVYLNFLVVAAQSLIVK